METCFKAFDKNQDDYLSQAEFGALCRALFRDACGAPYPLEEPQLRRLFLTFDTKQDNQICMDEFKFVWERWIKKVVRPVSALLIVDVQNDFISGSLAICNCPAQQRGEEVIPVVNRMLEEVPFDAVVYTFDWHPEDHVSFVDNVGMRTLHHTNTIPADKAAVFDSMVFDIGGDGAGMEQRMWPRHCVQHSWGAELHRDLKLHKDPVLIYKGINPDVDSYSAFFDNNKVSHTALDAELRKRGVTDVFVCGIATDVCVAATAQHALDIGYRTVMVDDACRGVAQEEIAATRRSVEEQSGLVVMSDKVKSLASGRDRPPALGLKLASELAKELQLAKAAPQTAAGTAAPPAAPALATLGL